MNEIDWMTAPNKYLTHTVYLSTANNGYRSLMVCILYQFFFFFFLKFSSSSIVFFLLLLFVLLFCMLLCFSYFLFFFRLSETRNTIVNIYIQILPWKMKLCNYSICISRFWCSFNEVPNNVSVPNVQNTSKHNGVT